MKITFLGKDPDSEVDDCPSLYDTDQGTYLVQGWKIHDPAILARLNLGVGETCVEVPRAVMSHLAKSGQLQTPDDGRPAPTTILTERDTYIVQGRTVTDVEALAAMELPDHESVVEVALALRGVVREEYAGVAGP